MYTGIGLHVMTPRTFQRTLTSFTFGDKFSNFNNHFIMAANERNNYAIAHTMYRFIADYNYYRPMLVPNTANKHTGKYSEQAGRRQVRSLLPVCHIDVFMFKLNLA